MTIFSRVHILGDKDETFSLMDKMDTSSQLSVSDGSKDHVAPTMTVPDSLVNHPTTDSQTKQGNVVISSNEEFQREFAVYHKSTIQESYQEDLPNSFFDVTPSDVLLMQQHLTNSVKSLENSPLRTLSMRQCSIKAEEDKYKRVRCVFVLFIPCTYCNIMCRLSYVLNFLMGGF